MDTVRIPHRFFNFPFFVMVAYLLLGLWLSQAPVSGLLRGLALALSLFGSGLSLMSILFPVNSHLDHAARAGLAGFLSLVVYALLGFGLANSPWGLRLSSWIVSLVFFNLICWILSVVQPWIGTTAASVDQNPARTGRFNLPAFWKGHWFSLILIGLILFGGLTLANADRPAHSDPPITEFYLIGNEGWVDDFPTSAKPGETITLTVGIGNQRPEPWVYEVNALIDNLVIGGLEAVQVEPGDRHETTLAIHIPKHSAGRTLVTFDLVSQQRVIQTLYLWFDIENEIVKGQ